jgi:hypothetical protein
VLPKYHLLNHQVAMIATTPRTLRIRSSMMVAPKVGA